MLYFFTKKKKTYKSNEGDEEKEKTEKKKIILETKKTISWCRILLCMQRERERNAMGRQRMVK
jgi:hypothetical protein